MQQVLFHIPFTEGWVTPEGVPVYGFGAMLFLTFVATAMIWGPRRLARVGLPKDRVQDLAIVVFLTGIAGARIVYMIQYRDQFPSDPWKLFLSFFQIWNGGIVFYGSVFGAVLGYALFYKYVLRRLKVSGWRLADACAPVIAFGLAVGRIGCYLNGCCWGQPVCPECQPVPLGATLGEFPLLPAHARDQVVRPASETDRLPQIHGLQTSTGFALARRDFGSPDPRSVVAAVEPRSAAEAAGLKPGDRVVGVNGQPNLVVVEVSGLPDGVEAAVQRLKSAGGADVPAAAGKEPSPTVAPVGFDDPAKYREGMDRAADVRGVTLIPHDTLWELVRDWPRGQGPITLAVERGAERKEFTFTPRTVPFFPTQLYETVSMLLLTALLLAFQPFRRHDGQVMVLLMIGYAAHRFLNEAIRIEPTYALDLTLSQWISVAIAAAGLLQEAYLRLTQPRLPPGPLPLSYPTSTPAAEPAPAA